MATNIEAEGRELILRNSNGDVAIIPKDRREEALGYLQDKNYSAIDSLVNSLPVADDYAKDGTLVVKEQTNPEVPEEVKVNTAEKVLNEKPEKELSTADRILQQLDNPEIQKELLYKGKPDEVQETTQSTFSQAFANARKEEKNTFEWNGKTYGTRLKEKTTQETPITPIVNADEKTVKGKETPTIEETAKEISTIENKKPLTEQKEKFKFDLESPETMLNSLKYVTEEYNKRMNELKESGLPAQSIEGYIESDKKLKELREQINKYAESYTKAKEKYSKPKAENGMLVGNDNPPPPDYSGIKDDQLQNLFKASKNVYETFSGPTEGRRAVEDQYYGVRDELKRRGLYSEFDKTKQPSAIQEIGIKAVDATKNLADKIWGETGKDVRETLFNTPKDYSEAKSVDEAYEQAKRAGETQFRYGDEYYSTESNLLPKEEFEKYGITSKTALPNNPLRDRLQKSVVADERAYGYAETGLGATDPETGEPLNPAELKNNPLILAAKDVMKGEKSMKEGEIEAPVSRAMLDLYWGKPVENMDELPIAVSDYKPSVSKDKNAQYFRVKNDEDIFETAKELYFNKNPKTGKYSSAAENWDLGNYTIGIGEDDQGKYISYYDNWDLQPLGAGKDNPVNKIAEMIGAKDQSMGVGNPIEVYNKRYIKDLGDGTVAYIDNEGNTIGEPFKLHMDEPDPNAEFPDFKQYLNQYKEAYGSEFDNDKDLLQSAVTLYQQEVLKPKLEKEKFDKMNMLQKQRYMDAQFKKQQQEAKEGS